MRAELLIEAGTDPGRRYLLAAGQQVVLGRGDDVEVPILDTDASRRHVAVALSPAGLTITDLGSKNGTTVDGLPLGVNEPVTVTHATIQIGAHRILARVEGASPALRVRDEFERVAELGRGGYGQVFAARHRASGRMVAIKTLLEKVSSATARERFQRECRLRIESPHVAQVYDVRVEAGVGYLIMELVDGTPVSALIKQGPVPIAQALLIGEHTALGLAAAHAQHVIHRDIKPPNLILSRDGVTKIIDFGIAKLRTEGAQSLTASLQGFGTLDYVPPEQAEDAKRVSPAADLYSLGATLYHLIGGRPPFEAGPDQIVQLLEDDPPALHRLRPECPRKLASYVQRLLEKEPADRPASATAVAKTLGALRGA